MVKVCLSEGCLNSVPAEKQKKYNPFVIPSFDNTHNSHDPPPPGWRIWTDIHQGRENIEIHENTC